MVHSCTSFGKLKKVVVGREMQIASRSVDLTFRLFYKEAIGQKLYADGDSEYNISPEALAKRAAQLDGLAATLEQLGVEVCRPDETKRISKIKTPFFESETTSANNVRDLALVYGDALVETPPAIRNRYFENMALRKVFREAAAGGRWFRAPLTSMADKSMDLVDWQQPRDFSQEPDPRFEMAIDGAQFLRLGRDCVVNVATWNHKLGLDWLKPFFPGVVFHQVKWVDNHLDGLLASLAPRVFLASPMFTRDMLRQLPQKLQSCKFIVPDEIAPRDVSGLTDKQIQLASSRGMDVNVLSVDEKTVLVNRLAPNVVEALEENGFDVMQIELDACELFAGGIHCSTLDLVREDEDVFYA